MGRDRDSELCQAMRRYVRNEAVIASLFAQEMTDEEESNE